MLLQVFHIGKLIALVQSSLKGVEATGSTTQISKPALVAEVGAVPLDEYTLM
jgi:hypothetical protein